MWSAYRRENSTESFCAVKSRRRAHHPELNLDSEIVQGGEIFFSRHLETVREIRMLGFYGGKGGLVHLFMPQAYDRFRFKSQDVKHVKL